MSYIFAGEKNIDLKIAMKKLKSLFGIEKLMCQGGPKTNELLFDVLPKILESQTEILDQLKALNYRIDKLERADRSKEDGLN